MHQQKENVKKKIRYLGTLKFLNGNNGRLKRQIKKVLQLPAAF